MKDGSSIHLRVLQYAHLEKNRLFQDFQISEMDMMKLKSRKAGSSMEAMCCQDVPKIQ